MLTKEQSKKVQVQIKKIFTCDKCELCKVRRNVVIGRGTNINPDILFIGEAPTTEDDMMGKAMVGKIGALFDYIIAHAYCLHAPTRSNTQHIDGTLFAKDCKPLTYYCTNAVLCRPAINMINQTIEPTKEQLQSCLGNVQYLINLLEPKTIIFTSSVAKRFYSKYIKNIPSFSMYSTKYVLDDGGVASTTFLHNVNIILDAIETLK